MSIDIRVLSGVFTLGESFGNVVGRIGPDLAEGRVVVRDAQEFGGGAAEVQSDHKFVDELDGFRADDGGTKKFARACIRDQLNEAVDLAFDHGFAVIVEGVAGNFDFSTQFGGFEFTESGGADAGVSENAVEFQAVVHCFRGRRTSGENLRGIVGGGFALLDGGVHDLVRAADVTSGKNVRRAGGHLGIGGNSAPVEFDARNRKIKTACIWLPPKGEHHFVGGDLEIEWADDQHVFKTGPAVEVFSGDMDVESI